MKKKNLKSLKLNKKAISNFSLHKLSGGGIKRSERRAGDCNYSRAHPSHPDDGGYCVGPNIHDNSTAPTTAHM